MDKPHSGPYTINTDTTSSQHSTTKGAWQSYLGEEKIMSSPPETSEQPTYSDSLQEANPSRPKRTESTTLVECSANEKKSQSAEYPFASKRGSIKYM